MRYKLRQHLSWLIPALLTVTSFASGLATEWIANDLQPRIKNRVWIAYVLGIACLIITAIFAFRAAKKVRSSDGGSNRQATVVGDVKDSNLNVGDHNTSIRSSRDR